jgi:DNA-binding CsgD family transcriptional regulator
MLSGMGPTEREQIVAALVCDGLSNKTIATQLGLSEGTVKAHVSSIFKKVGVRGRGALIIVAMTSADQASLPCSDDKAASISADQSSDYCDGILSNLQA